MLTLNALSEIVYGAGALNNVQYGADANLDAEKALEAAFKGGINAIDTSAYYGDSEIILGKALKNLAATYPRDTYFLTTKAGRWETNEFDYTPVAIRSSVQRSLERLSTDYLDALLIHDVEFKTQQEALTAIETAFELKKEGIVRYVGFSGLPLNYLLEIAQVCQQKLQPVDLILSYCNLTIQNRLLLDYKPKFAAAGVSLVMNASPLGMSLLRSDITHDWHPASQELKDKAHEIAQDLHNKGLELADIAEQYAFSVWTPTVVGMRSPVEVKAALDNLEKSKSPDNGTFDQIYQSFGNLVNVIWPSGIHT